MKITFLGADHEVTGSCHYVEVGDKKFLVDYGMEQGKNLFENMPIPVPEAMIDYVFLTHAHIDHSGLLPLLSQRGFRGKIYATEATADLCDIMLRDSAHIQMMEAEWRQRKNKRNADIEAITPLYTMEDAENAIRSFVPVPYDTECEVCENIKIRFTDVGHLLGSASIEVWLTEGEQERKIVFSGDIGNTGHALLREPQLTAEADYVLVESTYGDRLHVKERPDYVHEIAAILNRTFARGGNVVIPSFAVGRTQEMLYFFRQIKKEGLVTTVPDFPVYVDSPLAVDATEVFERNQNSCYTEEALALVRKRVNPLFFPGLRLTISAEESKDINFVDTPKVIISASGMCDAGRIKHHLKHNLWRPECTILFVGYQAVGTPGRAIVDKAEQIKLFGEVVDVNAEVIRLAGMSGHADRDGLVRWIQGFEKKPKKIFVVHGEDTVTDAFADLLRKEYGHDTYAPYSGTEFDLITGELLVETKGIPIVKKSIAAGVFERLIAAAQRLLAVARQNEGSSNKDLAKFADQINSLADKWERK